MSASRVISLAERAWTVRAVNIEAVELPPSYDTPEFREAVTLGVRARIPGCVHQALIDANLIESPDQGDAEERLQWVGATAWEYRCEFEWKVDEPAAAHHPRGDQIELVFDGLDTVAEVFMNGQAVGNAASFFVPWRFDVRDSLRAGRNEVVVRFTPPLVHIRAEEARLGPRPFNGDEVAGTGMRGKWDPFTFIRKPACNFGWDWGPRVATVGIAGGVRIERWATARIEHVRPLVTRADAEVAEVRVHVDALFAESTPIGGEEPHVVVTLRAPGEGGTIIAHGRGVFSPDDRSRTSVLLGVQKPERWWPRGYGPQARGGADDEQRPLYELRVELWDGASLLDARSMHIGLRTVELDTSPDNWGSAFTLRINGQPVFCMGANWIPEGLFAGYAREETIRERVRDAAAMNANMLRVWGGGCYETECFYDECDRRGILVWQDFMFACGMYPEEPPFRELVELEARHQVARLSAHASVVLWCGGNETIWGHDKWGWQQRLKPGQSWGSGYWLDVLPRVCGEVDPSRPYWPNSPWSGVDASGAQRDVLDPDHGSRHTWEVDAWKDGFRAPSAGGSGVPRFCSEFGQQSPSCIETLRERLRGIELPLDVRAQPEGVSRGVAQSGDDIEQKLDATEQKLDATMRELARRQRGPGSGEGGGDKRWYEDCGIGHPLDAAGFAEWLVRVHEFQARVVARGIEWHRVNRPWCGGVLFWQLNDCWAGHSWSAIDAAGRRKPLWEAARRAMSPRLLSIHMVDGSPMLYAVNDTDEAWEGEVTARRVGADGAVLAEQRVDVRIGPRTAGAVMRLSGGEGAWSAAME